MALIPPGHFRQVRFLYLHLLTYSPRCYGEFPTESRRVYYISRIWGELKSASIYKGAVVGLAPGWCRRSLSMRAGTARSQPCDLAAPFELNRRRAMAFLRWAGCRPILNDLIPNSFLWNRPVPARPLFSMWPMLKIIENRAAAVKLPNPTISPRK